MEVFPQEKEDNYCLDESKHQITAQQDDRVKPATTAAAMQSDATSATIYVRNLPTEGILPRTIKRALLLRFARWRLRTKRSVKLSLYPHTKGCAFVVCRSRDAAMEAVQIISNSGVTIGGKKIAVSLSRQKSDFTRRHDQDDPPGSIRSAHALRKMERSQRQRKWQRVQTNERT